MSFGSAPLERFARMVEVGASGPARHRVAGRRGGEGEGVGGVVVLLEHRGVARRLDEAAVEAGRAAGARHLHIGAVEGQLAALVHIQAIVQHAPDQPPRLADAEDQLLLRRRRALERMVAEIGQQVADAGQARAGDIGVLGHIGQLIDHAGPEAAVQLDSLGGPSGLVGGARSARRSRAIGRRGPSGAGALGQHRARIVGRRRLIGQAAHAGIGGDLARRADGELVLDLAR